MLGRDKDKGKFVLSKRRKTDSRLTYFERKHADVETVSRVLTGDKN